MLPNKVSSSSILIYHRPILKPEVYDKLTRQEREEKIHKHWVTFIKQDLPQIDAALKEEAWIWDPDQRSDPT